ncbi:MAG: D-alanine--D-alanine ligase [Gammaproteobacteria bacterium]|nr:D-alanine--D-alanine ligase [Gammaproteobacteria bacterium]MCW9060075.1 D-alanine--D-alanine ligase [Gammaproteobacteria bacterium]
MTDVQAFGKVAVLMGGHAAERVISLRSGQAVLEALRRAGVDAEAVDAGDSDVLRQLEQGGYDRVFNALHGRGGEDGVMQGCLELLGLPYTGSGVLASALAMDKLRTKQLWHGVGLPTPEFALLDNEADLERAARDVGFPMMIKPIHEGSSIGMSKVEEAGQLPSAWALARQYDQAVLAERWITGAEYTAAILGDEALPLIRLETGNVFYDYQAKYESNSTRYHCPCGLPVEQERIYQQLALAAFRALDGRGWGRVDFMVDGEGRPWLIELNTVPGMTDHSLVPMAARQAGLDFETLVVRILATSLEGEQD